MQAEVTKKFSTGFTHLKTALKRSLSLLISVGILALLFSSAAHMVNLHQVSKVLFAIDMNSLCILLLLMIITFLINSYRFAVIAQWILGQSISAHQAIKITWLSCFLALSTPFAAVGDIARAGLVKWLLKAPIQSSFQIVLFDRGFSLLCLMIFALLGSFFCYPILLSHHSLVLAQVIMPAGSLFIFGCLLVFYRRISWPTNRICHFLKETLQKLSQSLTHPDYLIKQIAISLCNIVLYILCILTFAHATHFSFDVTNLILFTPLMLIINNLPFFYFGLGGREAVFLMLLPFIAPNASSNAVLAASLGYGVLTIFVSLFGGIYLLGFYKKNHRFIADNDLTQNI